MRNMQTKTAPESWTCVDLHPRVLPNQSAAQKRTECQAASASAEDRSLRVVASGIFYIVPKSYPPLPSRDRFRNVSRFNNRVWLQKKHFLTPPPLLCVILSQVQSSMLTVSSSCEDAVTDNYSSRSSGWLSLPRVPRLLIHVQRAGPGAPFST